MAAAALAVAWLMGDARVFQLLVPAFDIYPLALHRLIGLVLLLAA